MGSGSHRLNSRGIPPGRGGNEIEKPVSIAYHGNVVDLLEYAVAHNKPIELLSDQTSCHAVYEGGYCPAGLSFEERTRLLHEDHDEFRKKLTNLSAAISRQSKPSPPAAHISSTMATRS